MYKSADNARGFTIVELLIVIVVIAILAAISVVAYTGIQDRARLSAAQSHSAQVMRSPERLNAVGEWSFSDCSGNTVRDASGLSNSGTIVGVATWSSDTPTGSGCSLQFNGSNTYITTGAAIKPGYYMKSTWVKIDSCSSANNLVSSVGSAHAWYAPSGNNNCRMLAGHNNVWTQVSDPQTLATGKWHFVAVEYEARSSTAGTLKLWRDGVVVAENTNVPPPSDVNTATIKIGAHGTSGGNQLTGRMTNASVYTREAL